jgi:hypothetical protein
MALQAEMLSPEMPVGVQRGGYVPIVQKIKRRFAWMEDALASRVKPTSMNGAKRSPAPTLPRNCLRVGMPRCLPVTGPGRGS